MSKGTFTTLAVWQGQAMVLAIVSAPQEHHPYLKVSHVEDLEQDGDDVLLEEVLRQKGVPPPLRVGCR